MDAGRAVCLNVVYIIVMSTVDCKHCLNTLKLTLLGTPCKYWEVKEVHCHLQPGFSNTEGRSGSNAINPPPPSYCFMVS